MKPYKQLSGNAGVQAYEIFHESIEIRFTGSREVYVYSYEVPGEEHVEKMKALAVSGKGLSTYISQQVKNRYASKYTR